MLYSETRTAAKYGVKYNEQIFRSARIFIVTNIEVHVMMLTFKLLDALAVRFRVQ